MALLVLTTISTVYEVFIKKLGYKPIKLLTIFSLDSNYNDLVKISDSKSIINCIDGLKVIACFWVVVGARNDFYKFPQYIGEVYGSKVNNGSDYLVNLYNVNPRSVDTFLACSGILVAQSFLNCFDKFVEFLLNILRIIRLTL